MNPTITFTFNTQLILILGKQWGDSLKQDLSFLIWDQNLAVRADSPTRPEGPMFRSWVPVLVHFGKKKKKEFEEFCCSEVG